MILTGEFLRRFLAVFRRMNRVLAVVLFVLFGWLVGFFGLFVTFVADLIGLAAPGRISQTARLGIGVIALVVIGALGNTERASRDAASVDASTAPSAISGAATPRSPSVVPSEDPSATPESPPITTATPTLTPSAATPTLTATPTPSPPPDNVTLADAPNDMVDVNDEPAKRVAYQDITKVRVEARAGRVQLDTWVAAKPPKPDPRMEFISFVWWLDTNADGSPEYQVLIENVDAANEMNASGWAAGLLEVSSGQTLASEAFPGTLVVDEGQVTVRVFLSALGFPDSIWAIAATESDIWADYVNDPTNDVLRHDYAPDRQWPNGNDWIRVSVTD